MGTFDAFADSPGKIRKEGQEITLKLDRTSPTTGRVSWNIPPPADGCTSETQAYCGIVIALDTVPASRSTTPVNGTVYTADPTANTDLHAGDKIGTSLVVGAFYEAEKKALGEDFTTFVDISGLTPGQVYYVAGYAVDCQLRYHLEGVHAYSLDLGNDGTPDSSGTVTVTFDTPIAGTDGTGLTLGQDYSMQLEVDGETYTIVINGSNAQTYADLVETINDQIEQLTSAPQSPVPPNTNAYYYNADTEKLFQWDGYQFNELTVLNEPTDPTALAVGNYWYNPTTQVLSRWNGASWDVVPSSSIIRYKEDLTNSANLDSTDYWYRPAAGSPAVASAAFQWCGNVWCQRTLYDQTTDPQLGAVQACGSYWYNPTDMLLRQWDETNMVWEEIDALYWDEDPNSLTVGTYWFDDVTDLLWQYGTPVAGLWNPVGRGYVDIDLLVAHQNSDLALVDGVYNEEITIAGQTINVEVNVCNATDGRFDRVLASIEEQLNGLATISFLGTQPSAVIRILSNDSTVPTIAAGGTLFAALTDFSSILPTVSANMLTVGDEPTTPVANQYWFDSTNGELFQRNGANTDWSPLCAIVFGMDPTDVVSCSLWWDSDNDVLNVWDPVSSMWVPVSSFVQSALDPSADIVLDQGALWYNNGTMSEWDGTQWIEVDFVSFPSDPTSPADGDVWFDTALGLWYVWSSSLTDWVAFNPVDSVNDPSQATIPTGTFWYDTQNQLLYMWNGTNWINVMFSSTSIEPDVGDLWYNLTTNTLMQWDGTAWVPGTPVATVVIATDGTIVFTSSSEGNGSLVDIGHSVVDNEIFYSLNPIPEIGCPQAGTDGLSGVPSYIELDVGTDGSPDERRKMIDDIRLQLGYPVVEVELTKSEMDKAVSIALQELRRRGSAYRRGFMKLHVNPGKQIYKLTKPSAGYDSEGTGYELADGPYGHDKIVQVMGCFRITSAFLTSAHGSGVFGQVVLQHLYNMGTFDLLSFHLVSEYIEQLEHLFASRLTFNWNETARTLYLHQAFATPETLLMDVAVERTEQDLLTDRFTSRWIERYALAESKKMLAQIRGKYGSLPGAGGGVSLNASDLATEAREELEALQKELDDYVVNNVEEFGMHCEFIIG